MPPVDDLALPDGLTSRPLTMDDAQAVYEVMAAQEQHDLGKVEIEPADIVGDWQKPSFDVGASTVGVFDGDTHGRVRRGQRVRVAATRPCTRRTAAAGSVRRSRPGCARAPASSAAP